MLTVDELVLATSRAKVFVSGGLIKEATKLKILICNFTNEFNIEFLPAGSCLEFRTLDGDYFITESIDLGADISYKSKKFSIKANHSNLNVKAYLSDKFKLTMFDLGSGSKLDISRRVKEKNYS